MMNLILSQLLMVDHWYIMVNLMMGMHITSGSPFLLLLLDSIIVNLACFMVWDRRYLRRQYNWRVNVEVHRSSITGAVTTLKQRMLSVMKKKPFFGDLFSEGGRSVIFTDRCDQAFVSVNLTSNYCNMLFQAASKVLGFLKNCVFSLE